MRKSLITLVFVLIYYLFSFYVIVSSLSLVFCFARMVIMNVVLHIHTAAFPFIKLNTILEYLHDRTTKTVGWCGMVFFKVLYTLGESAFESSHGQAHPLFNADRWACGMPSSIDDTRSRFLSPHEKMNWPLFFHQTCLSFSLLASVFTEKYFDYHNMLVGDVY